MKKQNFSYYFTPTAFLSNFMPLVVIFYNDADVEMNDFEYKMWNTLQIGYFVAEEKERVKELILQLAAENECDEYLYLYGDAPMEYFNDIAAQSAIEQVFDFSSRSLEQEQEKLKSILDELEKMVPGL